MSTRAVLARPPAGSGSARPRLRRALVAGICGLLCVGMAACESTEQKSAQIGRENAAAERAANAPASHAAAAHAPTAHAQGRAPAAHAHGHGGHGKGVTHG
jgi:hypothetical protein